MIETLSGTWAAGETKTFHINGQRLEILDAQYALDVYLMDKSGAQMSIMKNSEASFFSQPKEGFNSLQIYSAQAQFIRFFVGSGDAGTRRISSTVSVIDGARARVDAGVAYAGSVSANPVAGQYSFVQLWNPAGSGKRIVVDQVSAGVSSVANISFYADTAALPFAGATIVANKKAAGVVGAVLLKAAQSAAYPTFVGYGLMKAATAQGFVDVTWAPKNPILLLPGVGLNVVSSTLNTGLVGNFEWFEEAI